MADLPEFIFWPLSTQEGRVRQAQLEPTGLVHDVQRMVLAPEAGEPVLIRVRVGVDLAVVAMELRYSTDGACEPAAEGSAGHGEGGLPGVVAVPMERTRLGASPSPAGFGMR